MAFRPGAGETRSTLNRESRLFMLAGCLAALAAVVCGAFGSHVLKGRVDPELLSAWQTAASYHFFHALALLAVGLTTALTGPSRMLHWSGMLMIAGLLLFSGSLYLLAITGIRMLGAVTPLGGMAWIAAWSLLAAALWRSVPGSSRSDSKS